HERLSELVRREGHLRLRTQFAAPGGKAKIRIEASVPFDLSAGAKAVTARSASGGRHVAEATANPVEKPELLSIDLETGSAKTLSLQATCSTESDPTPRALPFGSLLLPWAPPHQPPPSLEVGKTELA